MSQCVTLTNIGKSCDPNVGGIREVYLWPIDLQTIYNPNQTTWSFGPTAANNLAVGSSANISSYSFTRESSNYTEELASDLVNGSTVWTATLNLMFTRREAAKSRAIKLMADGQKYMGALVKDENGIYWVFQDLQITASGEGSGTTREDGSKYSVTLVGKTAYPAYEIGVTGASGFINTGTAF